MVKVTDRPINLLFECETDSAGANSQSLSGVGLLNEPEPMEI